MFRKDSVFLALTAIYFTAITTAILVSSTANITLFETVLSPEFLAKAPSHLVSGNQYLLSIPAGVLIYAITFLIIDIIAEFYGKSKTIKVVIAGFAMHFVILSLLMLIDCFVQNEQSRTFISIFNTTKLNILALVLTFLVSQMLNVYVYHALMKQTKGRHLWLRNNISTIVSQIAGTTVLFGFLYAIGGLDDNAGTAINYIIANIVIVKVILALLDTPVLYALVIFLKENMTKFQPTKFVKKRGYNNNRNRNNRNRGKKNFNPIPYS